MVKMKSSQAEINEGLATLNYLLEKGIFKSRADLARALDVSWVTLDNWLKGTRGINPFSLDRLRKMRDRVDSGAPPLVNSGVQQIGNGVAVNTGVQPAHSPHDVLHIYRDLLIKRVIEADFMDDATKFKVISLVQTTRLAGEQ